MNDPDLSALGPLANVIALTVRTSRVRLGVPEDLVAPLTVAVAAYMGKQLSPCPRALAEIAAERARQDARWGEQNHPDGTGNKSQQEHAEQAREWCQAAFGSGYGTWSDVLAEEVAEVNAERDPAKLRAELIQVAAVAAAWIEAIDRRNTEETDRAAVPVEAQPDTAGYEFREALLVLLSRAARGVLTDDEGPLLRQHVEHLLGDRDQLAARVATLEHVSVGNRRHVQDAAESKGVTS